MGEALLCSKSKENRLGDAAHVRLCADMPENPNAQRREPILHAGGQPVPAGLMVNALRG
jgi:hypothetical protein